MKNQIDPNIFYRKNYKRLMYFLFFMIAINFFLVAFFIYQIFTLPTPRTSAAFENKITPLYPISEPIVSQRALLEWASQAAISVYNLDYLNYAKQMQANAPYFTPAGWRLFQNDFRRILNTIVRQKLRVTAVLTGPPVIITQGPLLGRYAWRIRMPILVTYESASETSSTPLLIDMVVMRVSTFETPKGIAIAQLTARERGARLGL